MRNDGIDLDSLEPQQFSAAARAPLPRRKLKRWELVLLSGLRIYVLIAIPLVAYAFWQALGKG